MFRPLRGRALVEILDELKSDVLVLPDLNPRRERETETHHGRILALGPPARTRLSYDGERWVGNVEVPWGCREGDVVRFRLAIWLDKMRRGFDWPGVESSKEFAVVGQQEILAVES